MNERIQQLARLSGATAEDGGRAEGVFCFTAPELADFANRLVRECALQCQHNDDMDRIEKHFGVES